MRGEPIEAVKVGLSDMIAALRLDPYALDTACISIITYDQSVKQVLPLTDCAYPKYNVPNQAPLFSVLR